MNEEKYFRNYITWEEFNAAIRLIYSSDKECVSLGKELLKNYNILYIAKTYLQMSYTATMRLLETPNGIAGILYIYNQKEAYGYLKDLYDEWIEWEINQPIH